MMRYLTDEVGIDGMMIAPGYQYSQIDPALTMTRDEHEEKFRVIRAATKEHGYRWIASPIYQDFLTGQRDLTCAPWGSITRNPYGWKGPCYLLTDGIFPTYEALLEGMEWEAYGPGNDPRCEHCAHPLRVRAVGGVRGVEQPEGDRAEPRVDADGLTFACATTAEERVAKRLGLRRGARRRLASRTACPRGGSSRSGSPARSAGCASATCSTRRASSTRPARRCGKGRASASAAPAPASCSAATSSSTTRPSARACARRAAPTRWTWRAASLARSGRLAGVVRAISDDASSTVEGVDTTVHADGRTNVAGLLRWVATQPRRRGPLDARTRCARCKALEEAVAA